jgi:hypothetical protein
VEVAVDAGCPPGVGDVGERRQRGIDGGGVDHLGNRCRRRRNVRQPFELGPEAIEPVLGRPRLRPEHLGQRQVQARGHVAERQGLGAEVAARLVGWHRGVEQVAQRGAGQFPGVRGPQQVLAHDGQVRSLVPQLCELGDDVGKTPLAQQLGDLDVGIGLRVHPAEQLEDEPLVVDHRGVRLLDDERPRHLRRLVRGHPLEHQQRQVGVDERVVVDPAVDLAERHPRLALEELGLAGHRPPAQHDLIGGAVTVGADGLDQEPDQHRVALPGVEGGDRHVGGRFAAGVPPLPGQEASQQRCQRLA